MKIERRTKDGWEDRGTFTAQQKPEDKPEFVDKAAKRWAEYWAKRSKRIEKLTDSKLKAVAKLNSL